MRKRIYLLGFILFALAQIAPAAIIVASGNASLSSNTNWVGGVKPNCTTDAVDTQGFTVTDDVAVCHLGDGTNIGVSCSVAGGKFVINTGLTATFKGAGSTTTVPWKTVANCTMDASAASVTMLYDCVTDYCVWINNGIFLMSPTLVQDAVSFVYSNPATMTVTGQSAFAWDKDNGIYAFKVGADAGGLANAGPISNAANTGVGSFGNTSLVVTAGGFDSNGGTTHVEKGSCPQGTNLVALLTTPGDYCLDYNQSQGYYKSASAVLTVTMTYKYGSWFSWGGWSTANAANNSMTVDGTMRHCGTTAISSESSGMGLFIDDMYAVGMPTDPTRIVTFGNSIKFQYCSRPLAMFNDHITGSNSSHHYATTGITFDYTQYAASGFQNGMIQISNISFWDITNPVLNSFANYFDTFSVARGPFTNIVTTGACGGTSIGSVLYMPVPGGATASAFKSNYNFFSNTGCANPLSSFNGSDFEASAGDGSFISQGGAAGAVNVYTDLLVLHSYRAGRLTQYTDVERAVFPFENHHGFIVGQPGYVDCSTITLKNTITYGFQDPNNFPGGGTATYNQIAWVDGCQFLNNTFNGETRSLAINDGENTVAAVTRYTACNNIASNNLQGIYRGPASATSNVINLGVTQSDGNNDFNNPTFPTNVMQGTFMFGGANYNTSGSKTALGVYAFSPSYSLPDATPRSIVMNVAGAAGSKTITVQWGGGTPVGFVDVLHVGQGTLTAFAAGVGSGCASANCPVLTDSAATFPTSAGALGLQAYFVMLTSGACNLKSAMIVSNTGTALTVFSNTATGSYNGCTPAAGDTYIIVKPDQQIFDAGAVQSIRVQLFPLELTTSNGTYTDSNITIAKNYPGTSGANNGVDPRYANIAGGDFHPRNTALKGTGIGGLDIGALPVLGGSFRRSQIIGALQQHFPTDDTTGDQ